MRREPHGAPRAYLSRRSGPAKAGNDVFRAARPAPAGRLPERPSRDHMCDKTSPDRASRPMTTRSAARASAAINSLGKWVDDRHSTPPGFAPADRRNFSPRRCSRSNILSSCPRSIGGRLPCGLLRCLMLSERPAGNANQQRVESSCNARCDTNAVFGPLVEIDAYHDGRKCHVCFLFPARCSTVSARLDKNWRLRACRHHRQPRRLGPSAFRSAFWWLSSDA